MLNSNKLSDGRNSKKEIAGKKKNCNFEIQEGGKIDSTAFVLICNFTYISVLTLKIY